MLSLLAFPSAAPDPPPPFPLPAIWSTLHCPCRSAFVRSQSVTSTVFSGGMSRTPLRATLHRYPPSRQVYRRSSGRADSTTGTRPISASSSVPYRSASSSAGKPRMMSTGTSSFVRSWREYRPSDPVPAPKTRMYTGSWSGTSSRSWRLLQHTPRAIGPTELFVAEWSSRENG